MSAVIYLCYGVCKSFFANAFLLKKSLQPGCIKNTVALKIARTALSTLAFVTIHPWEKVNGQLTNESARFDFCYVINEFICMIFRPDGVPGLLRFHQFTCCLLAEIHCARYEQNEFYRSNWAHFPVWRLSFCNCFFDNIILRDCFTIAGKK